MFTWQSALCRGCTNSTSTRSRQDSQWPTCTTQCLLSFWISAIPTGKNWYSVSVKANFSHWDTDILMYWSYLYFQWILSSYLSLAGLQNNFYLQKLALCDMSWNSFSLINMKSFLTSEVRVWRAKLWVETSYFHTEKNATKRFKISFTEYEILGSDGSAASSTPAAGWFLRRPALSPTRAAFMPSAITIKPWGSSPLELQDCLIPAQRDDALTPRLALSVLSWIQTILSLPSYSLQRFPNPHPHLGWGLLSSKDPCRAEQGICESSRVTWDPVTRDNEDENILRRGKFCEDYVQEALKGDGRHWTEPNGTWGQNSSKADKSWDGEDNQRNYS